MKFIDDDHDDDELAKSVWDGSFFGAAGASSLEPSLEPAEPVAEPLSPYDDLINESGSRHEVDPDLIRAAMSQESSFKPDAESPKGARGLMQLMPGTAKRMGVKNILEPKENIEGGTKYLRFLLDRYNGDVDMALAGYNAGEGAVDKYKGIPPYRETQDYVKKIRGKYQGAGYHPNRLAAQQPATVTEPVTEADPELDALAQEMWASEAPAADAYTGPLSTAGKPFMSPADIGKGPLMPPSPTNPSQQPLTVGSTMQATPPVPETDITLEAQREAAHDPASTRAGVLYTPGANVPTISPNEIDLPLKDGSILRADSEKLQKFLQVNGAEALVGIQNGTIDFSSLIGGKAEPTHDTRNKVAVVTRDEAGNELVTSTVETPAGIEREIALQKAQFPNRKTTTKVEPGQKVAQARQPLANQANRDQVIGTMQPGEMPSDAILRKAYEESDYGQYLKHSGAQDSDETRKEFNRIMQGNVDTVNTENQKAVDEYNAGLKGTAQGGVQIPSGKTTTKKEKGAALGSTTDDLASLAVRTPVKVAGVKGDKKEYALRKVLTEQGFTPAEINDGITRLRSQGEILKGDPDGDTFNVNLTVADLNWLKTGDEKQFTPATSEILATNKAQQRVDQDPGVVHTIPTRMNSVDAEKELEKRIKETSYSAQQKAYEVLSDPKRLAMALISPNGFELMMPASDEWTATEKKRLAKQHGTYAKAWDAEVDYQNMSAPETIVRFSAETMRSFTKAIVSGTAKTVALVDNLAETLGPTSALPESVRPSLRNAANLVDIMTRIITGAKSLEEATKSVKGSGDLSKTHIFQAAQQFDEAIGSDPLLRERFLGGVAQGVGSAASFIAMGVLMPALQIGKLRMGKLASNAGLGVRGIKAARKVGDMRFGTAASGALQMSGTGYEEGKQAGLSENESKVLGVWNALLGATEMFGGGQAIIKGITNPMVRRNLALGILEASGRIAKRTAKTAVKEAGEELVQEVTQTTGGKAALEFLRERDKPAYERVLNALKRLPDQVAHAVAHEGPIAMITGGLMGAGGGALTGMQLERLKPTDTVKPGQIVDIEDLGEGIVVADRGKNVIVDYTDEKTGAKARKPVRKTVVALKPIEETESEPNEIPSQPAQVATKPLVQTEQPQVPDETPVEQPSAPQADKPATAPQPPAVKPPVTSTAQTEDAAEPRPLTLQSIQLKDKREPGEAADTTATHTYSSTQVNLPKPEAKKVLAYGEALIDEEDVYTDPTDPSFGREQIPHVTVKYGLHTNDAKDVEKILAGAKPFKAVLGKTSIFPGKGDKPYDVVKADIIAPELHDLNKLIADNTEVTDTYPKYVPHVTLAYVKKGTGKKYVGLNGLEGTEIDINSIAFSGKDRQHVEIPLGGKAATPQPTPMQNFLADEKAGKLVQAVSEGLDDGPMGTNILDEIEKIGQDYGLSEKEVRSVVERAKASQQQAERKQKLEQGIVREPRRPKGRTTQGAETKVLTPESGKQYQARYVIREASDVFASHNPITFQPDPEYHFVNDRHYDREEQYQKQVIDRSKAFRPEYFISDTPTAADGPPVIDIEGNVLGGNSRTMILKRIYADSNDAARQVYQLKLTQKASQFGIDAGTLLNYDEPVLVREISDEEIDAQIAITELNEVSTTDLTTKERSIAEAAKLSDEAVDHITDAIERTGAEASLVDALNSRGVELVNYLIEQKVFGEGERNTLIDDGKITDDGKKRIERVLLGRIFTDLGQMENTPPSTRNTLIRIISPLMKVNADPAWNIMPELQEGIELLNEAKAAGQGKYVETFANNVNFLRPQGWTPEAVGIATVLGSGQVKAGKTFKAYAEAMRAFQYGQGAMIDLGNPGPAEAFKEHFGVERAEKAPEPQATTPVNKKSSAENAKDIGTKLPERAELPDSLGISRSEMPQIRRDHFEAFEAYANEKGVTIEEGTAKAADLLPTQNEYNPKQAAQLPDTAFEKPLMVSKDNRVLDGHNTLMRLKEDGERTVKIRRINLPALEALELMRDFPLTTYKTVKEVGATKANVLTYRGISVVIEPLNLKGEAAQIQEKTIAEVVADPKKWLDAYDAHPDTKGGIEVNADIAKELFEEYQFDPLSRVSSVHEASSILANLAFRLKLRALPPKSDVLFLAGGGGSGKGYALKNVITKEYPLIFDGTMKNDSKNAQVLSLTIDAEHNPEIVAVITPADVAAQQNVRRSISSRRLVPSYAIIDGHENFRRSFTGGTYDFAQEHQLELRFLFNDGVNKPTEISFEEFQKKVYDEDGQVENLIREATYAEIERGEFKGKPYDPRLRDAYDGKAIETTDTRRGSPKQGSDGPVDTSNARRNGRGQQRTSGLAPPAAPKVNINLVGADGMTDAERGAPLAPAKSAAELFREKLAKLRQEQEKPKDDDDGIDDLRAAMGFDPPQKSPIETEYPFYQSKWETLKPIFEKITSKLDAKTEDERMEALLRKLNDSFTLDELAQLEPYVVKFIEENSLPSTAVDVPKESALGKEIVPGIYRKGDWLVVMEPIDQTYVQAVDRYEVDPETGDVHAISFGEELADADNGPLNIDYRVIPKKTIDAVRERFGDDEDAVNSLDEVIAHLITHDGGGGKHIVNEGVNNPVEARNAVKDHPIALRLLGNLPAIGKQNSLQSAANESIEEVEDATDATKPNADGQGSDAVESPADVSGTDGQRQPGSRGPRASGGGARNNVDAQKPGNEPGSDLESTGTRPDAGSVSDGPRSTSDSDRTSNRLPVERKQRRDYIAPHGSLTREGSWTTAAKNNLDAIELLKKIESENRVATREEQEVLVKFVGWGATEIANNIFKDPDSYALRDKPAWRELSERLHALMTPEELKTASRSTQYAHYTSEKVIRGIWTAIEQFGFGKGSILEPGMGNGLFAVAAPKNLIFNSGYTGIEMDSLTARIAKQLLPDQAVIEGDFIKQKLPWNHFDVAIGNPPFADIKIMADPKYKKYRFPLHDYFFAKSLDAVRPGGLMVFVTSRYTMDKIDSKAKDYMAAQADLLGAIRLPQTAFKQNAGTEVVTDVLFFRKRMPDEEPGGEKWLGHGEVTAKNEDGEDQSGLVNEYYLNHPEMILGEHAFVGTMYGPNQYTVIPKDGDIEEHFLNAIKSLPTAVYAQQAKTQEIIEASRKEDWNPKAQKEGSLYIHDDGTLMVREGGRGVNLASTKKLSPKEEKWLTDYVGLRQALKQAQYDQLHAETEGSDWEASLAELNKVYDTFVKKNGNILAYTDRETVKKEKGTKKPLLDEDGNPVTSISRSFKNERLLGNDIESPLVWTLEKITDDGDIVKSDWLKERQIKPPAPPKIENLNDALMVSLDTTGKLNIPHVAELIAPVKQMTTDEVITELGDLIYEEPGGDWIMADEYLSGNVKAKLEVAMVAASDPRFKRNVEALQKVQPLPLPAEKITIQIGATWIPADVVSEFATEVLKVKGVQRTHPTETWRKITSPAVEFNAATGKWTVPAAHGSGSQSRRSATAEWGTDRRSPAEVLEAALNSETPTIKSTEAGPPKREYVDKPAMEAVQDKIKKMNQAFKPWLLSDPKRATELVDLYNEKMNVMADREFDGRHLTTPGLSLKFKLHPHVKQAIWRVIQTGNTYLAHAVGAGKTLEMIVSAMEQKRLGLINKPMFVVPNHMLKQFSSEYLEAYPLANIMVADEQNFHTDNRRRFVAQAALNDLDAVIITHSAFGLLRSNEESARAVLDDLLAEMKDAMDALTTDTDKNGNPVGDSMADTNTIKQIENRMEKIEQKFLGRMNSERDNVLDFEEMGVDFLYVDEAHEFRKLDFVTNRKNLKGIDPAGSMRALDLLVKSRWLDKQRPGRSMVLASGTPITNTMAELFSIQRFLGHRALIEDGLDTFDAWAKQFGESETNIEANAAGGYREVERFSKFVNTGVLMQRVRSFMDVITLSQLQDLIKVPKLKPNSKGVAAPEVVVTERTEALEEYLKGELARRIEASENWKPTFQEKHNPDPMIAIISDGQHAAFDMRFIDPSLPSEPNSKLNRMIDGVLDSYHAYNDIEYTNKATGEPYPIKGAAHIVFSFGGFGEQVAKNRGFDAKAWMRQRLVEGGIPASEIAFITDYKTSTAKEMLFKEVREGKKKVMVGSPKNMGTGVNAQLRLKTLHYGMAPWYPADIEQPHGRIIRHGNQNDEIELYWYAAKGTYDEAQWGMLARKSKAIEDAMTGNYDGDVEDVSESSQYAMASALASGDPRALRLAELRGLVEKYNRLEQAYWDSQTNLVREQDKLESSFFYDGVPKMESRVQELNAAIALAPKEKVSKENFAITIGKETFDKDADKNNAEIGTALKEAWKDAIKRNKKEIIASQSKGVTVDIATVLGKFPVRANTWDGGYHGIVTKAEIFIGEYRVSLADDSIRETDIDNLSESGLISRIYNAINGLEDKKARLELELKASRERLNEVREALKKPFEFKQESADARAEMSQLALEMAGLGIAVPPADITAEELKAIIDAYRGKEATKAMTAAIGNRTLKQIEEPTLKSAIAHPNDPSILSRKLDPNETGDDADQMTIADMKALAYVEFDELIDGTATAEVINGNVKLNAKGHEIIRRALEYNRVKTGKAKIGSSQFEDLFAGIFLKPDQVNDIVTGLTEKRDEAKELGYSPAEVGVFDTFINALKESARAGEGTAAIYILDRALPHELFHRADYMGAMNKALMQRHTKEYAAKLDGHKVATILKAKHFAKFNQSAQTTDAMYEAWIRSEIPPFLLESSEQELAALGITPEMAADYMLNWFEGYVAKNGIDALDNFDREEINVQEFIEQLKAANPPTSRTANQTRSDGKGNESNTRGPNAKPPSEGRGDPKGDGKGTQRDNLSDYKLRSLPKTMRAAGIEAIDEAYEVFHDAAATQEAARLLEENGVEGSIRLLRELPAEAQDAQHAILSFMLIKALQNHAHVIAATDPDTANKHFELSLKLAREHAVKATQAGRFTRIPSVIGPTLEHLTYAVQGIIEEKYGSDTTLGNDQREKWENLGRQLEEAFAAITGLRKEKRNLQAQVKRLKDEKEGKKRKRSTRAVKSRAQLVQLVKDEKQKNVDKIRERLRARFNSEPVQMSGIPRDQADTIVRSVASEEVLAELEERLVIFAETEDMVADGFDIYDAFNDLYDWAHDGDHDVDVSTAFKNNLKDIAIALGVYTEITEQELANTVSTGKKYAFKYKGKKYQFNAHPGNMDALPSGAVPTSRETLSLTDIGDSAPSLKSSIPEDFPIDDFAEVGAMMLTEGMAGEEDYLPHHFEAEMVAEFGDAITPYFEEIYKAAWNKRTDWLNEIRYQQTKERIENKYNEGEDLEDWQVEEILGEEKAKAKRRRAIENYHRMASGGKRQNRDLAKLKELISDIAPSTDDAIAAMLHAEKLSANDIYARMNELGITGEDAQRKAFRNGQGIYKQARIELQEEKDAIANEILAAEGELKKIDDLRWKARREMNNAQRTVAEEIRRIKKGELSYRFGQLVEVTQAMRTMMASFDMSGALRQGGFFTFARPELQGQGIVNMFKSIGETGYGRAIQQIEEHQAFTLAQRAGIDFAMAGRGDDTDSTLMGEELFRGEQFIEKIPILGWLAAEGIVKPSERTYTAVLDTQRMVMFDALAKELMAQPGGKTFKTHPAQFKAIAKFINVATGRGHMPHARMGRLILDMPLFAPRYTLSRLQLLNMTLNPVAYYNMPPGTRRIVAKHAARFYGTVGAILAFAAQFGLVAFDEDDSDWLKIKVGNTSYDLLAGMVQPARMLMRIGKALYEGNRVPGEMYDRIGDAAGRFARGKLSPPAGYITDALMGEDYIGREFHWAKGIGERLIPLTISDSIEAYKLDGAAGIAQATPFTWFGISTSTFKRRPERPVTAAEKLAARIISMEMKSKSSKPQTEDERKEQELAGELRFRARQGEDMAAIVEQMVREGKIDKKQVKGILAAAKQTYLEGRANRLSLDNLEAVLKVATPAEKLILASMLNRKMKNADKKGNLDDDQRKRLEEMGGRILGHVDAPAEVQAELDRHQIKTPDVGERLTVTKGGPKVELTEEQYEKYRKETLERIYKEVDTLRQTNAYNKAPADAQKKMIESAIRKQRSIEQKETKDELSKGGPAKLFGNPAITNTIMNPIVLRSVLDHFAKRLDERPPKPTAQASAGMSPDGRKKVDRLIKELNKSLEDVVKIGTDTEVDRSEELVEILRTMPMLPEQRKRIDARFEEIADEFKWRDMRQSDNIIDLRKW